MLSFWLCYSLPDLGAAVGALIDEVDLRHAPMGLDVSHVHREQSYATGADHRSCLNFVVLDVGWHVGSPSQRKHGKLQPRVNLPRMTDADHQLLRTYKEQPHNLGLCGFPVTFWSVKLSKRLALLPPLEGREPRPHCVR